ncbi:MULTISPECIES: ferritin-like domain-containing protein [Mesobacillus]|uniref:Ferritin-like domain-containing protein n=1 Tax=Mesobacillus selenatarsenatis TaxID=388741 RepID=A0A846TGL7_9BACI|nr:MULTISPECIES: ferritin-like domain-containing protein [Mesobacillus]NKE06050.1 ferritin-like domain-containing protein [Mesobacillus selenatarsenatis]
MYPYYDHYRQNQKLISDLIKAINGEYSATRCYEKLAGLAPDAEQRDQIKEILDDEKRHLRQFTQIYTTLTGKQPQLQMTEKCSETYRQGLEASFKDEQKTTDFYHEIADDATDPVIKEVFRRAAFDEQNHAVWFLYYIGKEK